MLEDEVHILLRQQTKIKLLKESTMSNFKVGDEVVCIDARGAEHLKYGAQYVINKISSMPCCGILVVQLNGIKLEPQYYAVDMVCDCGCVFPTDTYTFRASRFEKPRPIHTKSTIHNQQVLKRLATLPQVTERIEIPVRKQEGAEV